MIKEVIVVEGKNDTAAIRRAVEADTIETGGSAVNETILRTIELAQERRGIIILTDPDHAGERIRRIVSSRVKGCKHAFINREDAINGDRIGVEYAASQVILKALQHVRTEGEHWSSQIGWSDFLDAGLINHAEAAKRRLIVGKQLGIGYANGKQFFKRCTRFHITRNEFLKAVQCLESEVH